MKRRKVRGQEQILAEHLDELERSDFFDFDKPQKCTYQKGKLESNEQSKEGGQMKSVCGKGSDPRQSQALEKSIVDRIVQETGLGLLNPSEMD